jgi:hypothetical protein
VSWSQEEEARYQALISKRSSKPSATPVWSPADEARHAALSEKLHPTAKTVDNLDAAFAEDDSLGSRLHKGVEAGGEYSGVSSLYRLISAKGPYDGMKGDIAQVAMLPLGGVVLKALGVPLAATARGVMAGALGAGIGEAALGPEARKQGAMVEQSLASEGHPDAGRAIGGLVAQGPQIFGGTLGPMVPGMAKTLAQAAASTSANPAVAGWGKDWRGTGRAIIGGPATAALETGRREGKYLTPQQAQALSELESEGIQMTPGQSVALANGESLNGGVARSPQLAREVVERSRPEAARFYAEQNRQLGSAIERMAESAAPGASAGASRAGGNLQAAVRGNMARAEKGMEKVAGLVTAPEANAPNKWMRHDVVKAIDDYLSSPELGMVKGRTSAIEPALQRELLSLREDAAKVKTLGDAARLRQRVATQLLTLKEKKGLPEAVAAKFYGAVRKGMLDAVARGGKNGAKLASQVDKALTDYHNTFFSTEGRFAQNLAGEAGAASPATKSGSQVAEAASQEARADRLGAAVKAGSLDKGQVQAAIVASWLEASKNASGTGYDAAKLFRNWKNLEPETRAMLDPAIVAKLDSFTEKARYTQAQELLMPNKASGGAVQALGQLPGAVKAGLDAAGRLARPGYYSFGAQAYRPAVAPVASRAARMADLARAAAQGTMSSGKHNEKVGEENRRRYLKEK